MFANQKFCTDFNIIRFALDCTKNLRTHYLCWLWLPGARWNLHSQLLSWLGHGKHRKSEGSGLWYLCSWRPSWRSDSFVHSDPTLQEDKMKEGGKINPPLTPDTILKQLSQSTQRLKVNGDWWTLNTIFGSMLEVLLWLRCWKKCEVQVWLLLTLTISRSSFFKRTLDDGWWLYSLHTQQFNRNNSCKKVPFLFSIFHLENVKNVIIWFQWEKKGLSFSCFY